jgi:hypothetical protein
MIQMVTYPLKNVILNMVRLGWLDWLGPWPPRMNFRWQDLWREMRPLKIRWGRVLLLAIALVLIMGELGPAASAIAALP